MQVLELQFWKTDGKTFTVSVENPKLPVDEQAVSEAMDRILAAGIFVGLDAGSRKKGARVVERNVTDVGLNM
ncbi:DUF2922 domain-containing protein [Ectobacillus ponti]|uniref:DUF2922 domain-containing protein n=1 Tax=Ectobacillus ponti TaxID=2961894 RepID=A0AA41X6W5_9BACI|nr:DUF2922 domain-containing protein [Ectobacillus ponti]MCP8967714.1 DUF2922 domain-containing protein [Ectobacillus ponti]